MTDPNDPARLAESPRGLGEALRAAQSDVASPAQLERLAARLGPLLGPPAPGPGGAPPSSGAALGAAKLVATSIALIVAGGAAWKAATYHQPAPPPAPSAVSAAAPPAPASMAPGAAPLGVIDLGSSPAEAPSVAPVARPGLPKASRPAAMSEAELLEQARSAMKTDPARALARANEHRQRFPGGALVQEREVIAIKALRALGRAGEADARAAAFAKAFPGSAFERKLKPGL